MSSSTALLVVDLQYDFLPGGALAVPDGDQIVEPIADLVESGRFDVVVATQDWHPPNHISFASSHPGRSPFDEITLHDHPQILWPDHCVQDRRGAELHSSLPMAPVTAVIRKGSNPEVDSYSAFRNNWNAAGERPPTGLAGFLKELDVGEVWLVGLTRDFCARWSAEDAADAGFRVHLIWDLTRAVDPDSDRTVREALTGRGVVID
jgi:nicotinamidase/pyrazinamidase